MSLVILRNVNCQENVSIFYNVICDVLGVVIIGKSFGGGQNLNMIASNYGIKWFFMLIYGARGCHSIHVSFPRVMC